jgi:hypothetical protein
MLAFSALFFARSEHETQINSGFIRRLALQSLRLGVEPPLIPTFDESTLSVRERYAPMYRLLVQDDELFLMRQGLTVAAKYLRRAHRSCYFSYLLRLRREIRSARKLQGLAMASKENWSFRTLLMQAAFSESSLLYLGWLGCRHAFGVNATARDVAECLDFLLAGPRFRLVTT